MDLKAIGERVRAMRDANGWSQKRLAKEAGCSQQHISFVERAKTNVTWDMLEKVLGAFGQKLWVRIYDPTEESITIEVSPQVAELVGAFDMLLPADRELLIRFSKSLPVPDHLKRMATTMFEDMEIEARRRREQESG